MEGGAPSMEGPPLCIDGGVGAPSMEGPPLVEVGGSVDGGSPVDGGVGRVTFGTHLEDRLLDLGTDVKH